MGSETMARLYHVAGFFGVKIVLRCEKNFSTRVVDNSVGIYGIDNLKPCVYRLLVKLTIFLSITLTL